MAAAFEEVSVLEDFELSPIQWDVFHCDSSIIAFCAGRRVGKTEVGAPKIFEWMHQDLDRLWVEVAEGRRPRWRGEGMDRHDAARIKPDIQYWIVAPREDHLTDIKGALRLMYTDEAECWLHPAIRGLYNKGKELWVWQDGVCGRYQFKCAASEKSVVAKGVHGVWIEEAGLLDNEYFEALIPVLWDFGARMLCTGNPEASEAHWFTKLCKSGLDPGHERYDPRVSRNSRVATFIANTIEHAFLRSVRLNALNDLKYKGEVWASRFIYADWRQKARNVYREWNEGTHVVPVRQTMWWEVGSYTIKEPPDRIDGLVDWSDGVAPGAAVVNWVWHSNPIDQHDPRPLIVSIEDYEGHDAYTRHGWWGRLMDMQRRLGVDRWIPDPHSPHLVKQMKRFRDDEGYGFVVKEGPWQDKTGRIALVASQLHYDSTIKPPIVPAYYCSMACENLQRQFKGYRFQVKKGTSEVSSKPKQWDDHCLDCLAMHVSEVCSGPGLTRIGYQIR